MQLSSINALLESRMLAEIEALNNLLHLCQRGPTAHKKSMRESMLTKTEFYRVKLT